jgi:hypothetical protein
MTLGWLSLLWLSLFLALLPAILFHWNLGLYRPAGASPAEAAQSRASISVLIPARNEQLAIGPAVLAALDNRGVEFEVVVLDDHSDDQTAARVQEIAATDRRVRLERAPRLPAGWCGKQHACWVLAHEAKYPTLVFLDADVRLAPGALGRMAAFLEQSGADLVSGIPRQETAGLLEKLVIPLIHFILLGFLPIGRMRRDPHPGYAAGCGQLFVTTRRAYDQSGGHAGIRTTLHDGIKLPRAYRQAGLRTDLFDATDLAVCRMYQNARSLWSGLAKNAGEGLASPQLIVPMTFVLFGGQVLPFALLALGLAGIPGPWPAWAIALALAAVTAAYYPRFVAIGRFRQSPVGALLHPIGVLVLLLIQWYAFVRGLLGRPSTWKGRPYPSTAPRQSTGLEQPAS